MNAASPLSPPQADAALYQSPSKGAALRVAGRTEAATGLRLGQRATPFFTMSGGMLRQKSWRAGLKAGRT